MLLRCSTSEQGLRGVHVCGDEARDDDVAGEIINFFIWMFESEIGGFVNVRDSGVLDKDGAVGDDLTAGVDGHDRGMCVEHIG